MNLPLGASFRDPAGFVFKNDKGEIVRQIEQAGLPDFNLFIDSGLYGALLEEGLIIPHTTLDISQAATKTAAAVIRPQQIPFISYPFEWSFSQLQDAALLTIAIQKKALAHGMTLKDASAYNVQFVDGRPVFIDTLSFEKYVPGGPWQAYRQFCQHFLAPLALMAYTDQRLSQLLRVYLDGIELDLATKLLPRKAKLRLGIGLHIVAHGKAQKAKAVEHKRPARTVSQTGLEAILRSLERTTAKLRPYKTATEWGDYYDKTNYTADASDLKARLVKEFVKPLQAHTLLDLGGNNGRFSRTLHDSGLYTVCADVDPNAVEANYRQVKLHKEKQILPLVVDLTNPGGSLGWHNAERAPLHDRLTCDVVMALALIHHLAISNNLPFEAIARYLKAFAPYCILEFVPKTDSQVQKLLSTRRDIFPDYTKEGLVRAFSQHFTVLKERPIKGSKRTLYLFKRK
jgi:ribosomal protein L11 methylase PrmA